MKTPVHEAQTCYLKLTVSMEEKPGKTNAPLARAAPFFAYFL